MTESQEAVFYSATLETFNSGDLYFFIVALFWALLFLWAGWTSIQLVMGFARGQLKESDLARYLLRTSFVIIFMAIILR